ncbi:MAG: glycosyltransferase [Candidatus Saccharibacteria bacterium]
MRLLMISDHADPLADVGAKEVGGQNIYVLYLAKFLTRMGLFVDVYTRWDRKNKKEVVEVNSRFRVIRVKAGPKGYMPRDNFLNVTAEFSDNVLKRLKRDGTEYDLIHTNYWFSGVIGLALSKKLRLPQVHVYHSLGQIRFETLNRYKQQSADSDFFRKRTAAEKQIAKEVAGIISTSPVEKQIIKNLFGISGDKIEMIPIGVDTEIFHPAKSAGIRRQMNLSEKTKLLLYVGRLEWRKGIGTLLYAFAKVLERFPDSRLLVVGGGTTKAARKLEEAERERLAGIASQLKIEDKVKFVGSIKQKRLYRYYNAADVCVVPSYYEPFGIVPLEAMACGTPVVASRTGGLKYTVLDGRTGYLATPRNFGELAEKIGKVLARGKERYSPDCLARISEQFCWTQTSKLYPPYFQKLIDEIRK